MAYNEELAARIESILADRPDIVAKKMFGGIAFMERGNMCCGVIKDELMVRVGTDAYDEALAQPHARPMDFTGRVMKRMIYVGEEGIASDADLRSWVELGLQFTSTLPAK